jgi:hypothetical protein
MELTYADKWIKAFLEQEAKDFYKEYVMILEI